MRRGERGFTLLEVVIAFTLLAAVLAVVLRLFSEGASGTAKAERRTIALLHAESKLAELQVTTRRPTIAGVPVWRRSASGASAIRRR
jgi:general secretion pathway protein I